MPATLTPELAGDLDLPPDFLSQAKRSGLFLREHEMGEWSYHPLFRSFLRERLRELRPEAERAELHARAAAGLAATGRAADAIEHWLEAGRFEEALSLLLSDGAALVRTAPETVGSWLEAVPGELRVLAGAEDLVLAKRTEPVGVRNPRDPQILADAVLGAA